MIDNIIAELAAQYVPGSFPNRTSFYLSIGDIKRTVILDNSGCTVQDGKGDTEADCVCKTTEEMFARIWNDGYRPGMMDFMTGKIKSNQPLLLQQLLQAFGK